MLMGRRSRCGAARAPPLLNFSFTLDTKTQWPGNVLLRFWYSVNCLNTDMRLTIIPG